MPWMNNHRVSLPAWLVWAVLSSVFAPLPGLASPVPSEVPIFDLFTTDGSVRATAEKGDVLYVGGRFGNVLRVSGGAAIVTPDLGEMPQVSIGVEGTVSCALSDGHGGWFIGGAFTRVRGVARTNLVHLISGNQVDPTWSPSGEGGSVRAFARSGHTVCRG